MKKDSTSEVLVSCKISGSPSSVAQEISFFECDAITGQLAPIVLKEHSASISRVKYLQNSQTPSFLHDSISVHHHACFQPVGYSVNHLSQDHMWYMLSFVLFTFPSFLRSVHLVKAVRLSTQLTMAWHSSASLLNISCNFTSILLAFFSSFAELQAASLAENLICNTVK